MRFLYLLAGIMFFLGALLWTLPADKALYWWGQDLPVSLRLYAPQGGLGQGSASAVAVDTLRLGPTDWRLRPASALKLRLGYVLESSFQDRPMSAVAELAPGGRVHLHDVRLNMPIASMLPLVSGLNLPLGGVLSTDIQYLRLHNDRIEAAQGDVTVQDIQWQLMRPPLSLGSARLKLVTEDGQIVGELSDQPGAPVQLRGTVTLDQNNAYQADIQLKPRSDADSRLRNMMQGLGRPDAQGWYKLRTQGNL